MGRHRPLWLCSALYGLCIEWNSAALVMGSSETWIDIGCYGFPCLLWALRPGKLCGPVMGKSQFRLGLSTFHSFCYQSLGPVWVELPHRYHAVSWAGPDLLFVHRVASFCCSCPSSCAGVHLSTWVISQYVQKPRAETASPGLGPWQGGVNCVHVPGRIQVLESMGIVAQCSRLACRLCYICPLCGVSYPGGEMYVCC